MPRGSRSSPHYHSITEPMIDVPGGRGVDGDLATHAATRRRCRGFS